MKKYILIFTVLIGLLITNSCGDQFLERESHDPDLFYYKTEGGVRSTLTGVYNVFYSESLEGFYLVPPFVSFDYFTGLCYPREENTSISAGGGLIPNGGTVLGVWKTWYQMVAKANTLISQADVNQSQKIKEYVAEARVLRALGYYILITTYGDVPLYTGTLTISDFKMERTSKVEIMNFILKELDEAGETLPTWTATERGHVDKAAAYALKARAALAAGSLNYDNKRDYYFRISEEAARKVIGKRGLAQNFDDLFTTYGQKKADVRDELIWEVMYGLGSEVKNHGTSIGQVSRNYGQTARHPSQRLFDTYECTDGKRIDESDRYDPKNPKKNRDPRLNSTIWIHGDTVCGNTNGTPSGRIKLILNAKKTPLVKNQPQAQFYNYEKNVWEWKNNLDFTDGTGTSFASSKGVGYMMRKFANDTIENNKISTIHIPIIRYAEVLLTFAEAKIELGEWSDPEVIKAINDVRGRVGMPGILEVDPTRISSQDKMRQIVRRERKVELINEGLHFVDMRRWNIGDLENDGPSYGMPKEEYGGFEANKIPNFKKTPRYDLNDIASYDEYKDILMVRDLNRTWDAKFNLWPIPYDERMLNPSLTQNDGYQ